MDDLDTKCQQDKIMTTHQCPICKRESDCLDPNCTGSRDQLCEPCGLFVLSQKVKKEMDDMIQKFRDDPKKFEQNLPNVNDKNRRRTKIPNKTIPFLIKALFENSKRFRKDAEILLKSESCESSIVKLIECTEELTKLRILLTYYKKGEDVSEKEVQKLFRKHQYRLQEFTRDFHDSAFGKSKDHEREFVEFLFEYSGHREQDIKEKLIYVDWIDNKVHNPLNFSEIAKGDKDLMNNALKTDFKVRCIEIDRIVKDLTNDPDFKKIIDQS